MALLPDPAPVQDLGLFTCACYGPWKCKGRFVSACRFRTPYRWCTNLLLALASAGLLWISPALFWAGVNYRGRACDRAWGPVGRGGGATEGLDVLGSGWRRPCASFLCHFVQGIVQGPLLAEESEMAAQSFLSADKSSCVLTRQRPRLHKTQIGYFCQKL